MDLRDIINHARKTCDGASVMEVTHIPEAVHPVSTAHLHLGSTLWGSNQSFSCCRGILSDLCNPWNCKRDVVRHAGISEVAI